MDRLPCASICFFNNKGGVGKTTLACNVGAYIAQMHNLRVLLVDADPQCNATQLILPEETTEQLYQEGQSLDMHTLRDVLAPLNAGEATLSPDVRVAPSTQNRFGVSVLPGHPKVALLEDHLSSNWSAFLGGALGGARVSNWNTQLLRSLKRNFDLIIYDVGPSLGGLNRSVLIGVDYFVAPMGCDIFSLIGIANIAEWLADWRKNYDRSHELVTSKFSVDSEKYRDDVRAGSSGMSRFVGYTVQQYITKTIRKERRATSAYEAILKSIPEQVKHSLSSFVPPGVSNLHLGDVPHMYSLVPLAQGAHAPIHALTSKDGLSGGAYGQQQEFVRFIEPVVAALLDNLREASKAS